MARPIEEIDRAQRKRVVLLSLERAQHEAMIDYCNSLLGEGNHGPAVIEALMYDRQQAHTRVVAIIAEIDAIHAERVRLGLAS